MSSTIAGIFLVALTVADAAQDSPVTRVVGLIEELKAKVEADGKAEQMIYDKYACWCETTSDRKATNIHTGMETIKSLGTTILELKSKVTSLSHDIHELTMEMNENQAAQDEATGIRQKENAAYSAAKAEMEQTLSALQRGIEALTGAGTKTALLQVKMDDSSLRRIAAGVNRAVDNLPIDRLLSKKQLKLIKQFSRDPAEYYDQKAQKAASYNPASATIMGILKDMYDTFSANLETSTETEAVAYKNYESLMGVKANEMATLTKTRQKKEEAKAAAEKDQADNEISYDDAVKQLKEDTEFFDTTKKSCNAKADEWSERVRSRTEELAGINKAIEILTGDDAKALFNKAIKPGMETFLLQESTNSPRGTKAIETLKKGANRSGSLRLTQLAANLQSRVTGHFDAVTGEIDKMKEVIKEEEKADIAQKDWCKEEKHKNEQEASRFEYKIEKEDAHIGRLRVKIEELEAMLTETINGIVSTKDDIKKMEEARIAEHNAYETAKSDDEGAVKLLGMAIEALSAHAKNNPAAAAALLQQPTFEVSPDQAPDASFSSANKRSGASGGIVSIMTMLKEDLEDEITNGVKNEMENQMYFEKSHKSAHELLKELKEKKVNLEGAIADTNGEVDESNEKKDDLNGLMTADLEYIQSIRKDCDWLLENFEKRRATRQAEMQSLIDAKGILEGTETGTPMEGTAAAGAMEDDGGAEEAPAEEAPAEAGASLAQVHERHVRFSGHFMH